MVEVISGLLAASFVSVTLVYMLCEASQHEEKASDAPHISQKWKNRLASYTEYGILFTLDSEEGLRFSVDVVGRDVPEDRKWLDGILIVTRGHIDIYRTGERHPMLHLPVQALRGYYWLPSEQTRKQSVVWIHLAAYDLWYLLRVQVNPPQDSADKRRLDGSLAKLLPNLPTLPPVHLGAVEAHLAVQDDDDTWVTENPVQLFLMPHYLVVLHDDGVVRYTIATEDMQAAVFIATDDALGIVRLTVNGVYRALALPDAQRWTQALRRLITAH